MAFHGELCQIIVFHQNKPNNGILKQNIANNNGTLQENLSITQLRHLKQHGFCKIGRIEVQRGLDPLMDKEAIKVIKLLPNFIPGMQNGKKVNVWYSIPIRFTLN